MTDLAAPAVVAFAEQFVVDVTGIDDAMRAGLGAALGAGAFPYVQSLYLSDLGGRVDAACRELGIPVPELPSPELPEAERWPAIDAFLASVARRRELDPVTSELVRLRGARAHECRLCKSLRSVSAIEAGAGDDEFAAVDDYERSALPERHKVALRIVDAMVWTPAAWPPGLAAAAHEQFSDVELEELVLDVMRNAANKIAVAFAADQAHVTEGVEYYDIDADGGLVYGLARP